MQGTYHIRRISIRMGAEMLEKISFIADYEGRSINSHILVLVRENIRHFEQIHGKIEEDISPDDNVKPWKQLEKEISVSLFRNPFGRIISTPTLGVLTL